MWAVCCSFASTTKSYTLEEECRTLVIVQAFFEHKNSYQVQIYLTHETTDNSLRPPEESFHSFCHKSSDNFPLKMKAWKQNMLCLFDFLAATRRIGNCLMNQWKNQSLFQSEILWWGLDTMTWATWSKKFFWDQTNKVKMLFTLWRVIQVTTNMWFPHILQWKRIFPTYHYNQCKIKLILHYVHFQTTWLLKLTTAVEAVRGYVNVHTLWSHPSSLRTRTVFNGDSVTGWKGKAMLRRGFHKNERYNGPRVERFYKSNRILGFSWQSLQKRNLDHSEARSWLCMGCWSSKITQLSGKLCPTQCFIL